MITAKQLAKVLEAQEEAKQDAAEYGFEFIEVGIDSEYAFFKLSTRNVDEQALKGVKEKTRFALISEQRIGSSAYVGEFKIAA